MYIYGGILSLEEYDTSDIINILVAANELNLQELVIHLQSFLIENKSNWLDENFNLIYQISFEHDSFFDLQNFCTNLMFKEPEKIFNSVNFVSIPEKSLVSLIQNDNLPISDVQVWDYVLKWGLAQNPELSSDPSNYSKNDCNNLKITLQQCIPFIRFYNLTSKEFLAKVLPYKKILPKELYKELLEYFLDHDSKPSDKSKSEEIREIKSEPQTTKKPKEIGLTTIDTKIITNRHAELISKWIYRMDTNDDLRTPHEFKLLFRGSRDGFAPQQFHDICVNQTHTVTVIKVKDCNEILGGYNPIAWERGGFFTRFSNNEESFIFSFKDKESIENHILSRVKDNTYAIRKRFGIGPSFGSSDLIIDFSYNYCKKGSYEKEIRKSDNNFSIEEFEVFKIIQRSS